MLLTNHFKGWWQNYKIKGCRNTKLGQEKELSAHVWTSCKACIPEEDDMKHPTERYTVHWWDDTKDLEIYKSKGKCKLGV